MKTKKPARKTPVRPEWSKPYCGITHLGKLDTKGYRVTVVAYNRFAELHRYFPDCGFSPLVSTHKNVEAAKRAGEKYLKKHT